MVSPGALPPTPDVFPSFKKKFFFLFSFGGFYILACSQGRTRHQVFASCCPASPLIILNFHCDGGVLESRSPIFKVIGENRNKGGEEFSGVGLPGPPFMRHSAPSEGSWKPQFSIVDTMRLSEP